MVDTRLLGGRYEIDAVLGRGGMAVVYHGTDRVLGRQIAVKVLDPQYAADDSFVTRFRREAQAAAALNHPNVVNVFDTGSDDGTHFIVMEFVRGKTLSQIVREDAPLLPERAVEIAESVAGGLAFAHRNGIVHRDVKPGNIMLTPQGDVKVMDFGIARATSSESLTQTATVLGTATYFSPEQAQGQQVDARSDIYSLGCVLFEMLTGQPPFSGDSPVAVAYKHVKESPVPPSRLNPDVPPDVDAVVMKSLAKNPANRYQTADELRQDLARVRSGHPVLATPLLPAARTEVVPATRGTAVMPTTTPVARRSRRWIGWVALLVVLALVVTGLALLAANLLSSGDLVTVPDVRGRSVRVAQASLARQGFESDVTGREASARYARGTVADYDPKKAKTGDTIHLIVSTGPPVTTVNVPDVACSSLDAARATLLAKGLQPQLAGTAANSACQPGEVAKTDPAANQPVAAGSVVKIFTVPQPSPTPTTPPPTSPSPTPTTPPPTSPSPTPTTPPPTTATPTAPASAKATASPAS